MLILDAAKLEFSVLSQTSTISHTKAAASPAKAMGSTMRTAFREDPADPALEGNAVEAADAGVDSDDDDVEGNPEPDTTAEFEVAIALVRPGEPTAPTTPPLDGEPRKADKLMLNVKVRCVNEVSATQHH